MENNQFCSKILLSGEYIIFFGAKALALPYQKYSGKLGFITAWSIHNTPKTQSNQVLQKLYLYFVKTLSNSVLVDKFNLKEFKNDIERGLYFGSNIPEGYGIGSSGALTAAIYNNYATNQEEAFHNGFHNEILPVIKNELAYIESYFHGKSSGIDALVSFVNKPLLICENSIETVDYNIEKDIKLSIVIIDTGKPRSTQDLINRFNNGHENIGSLKPIENELIPASNGFTNALLENNVPRIFTYLQKVSQFQFDNFKSLIVPEFLNFWEQGLKSEKYYLKLCGSGGGGYLLGFVNDMEYFNNEAKLYGTPFRYEPVHFGPFTIHP
jgi:mevalonate kinase